jgi:hypothetical protein
MFKRLLHFVLFCCVAGFAGTSYAGEVVDRIVATVNGHILLQSDWDEAASYEAFADGHELTAMTREQRKAVLDRLIDQELIREQVRASDFPAATPADIDQRIAEIRKLHAEVIDQASWTAALQRYGLNDEELRAKVTEELDASRAVDARLRPNVQVDSRKIEQYYNEKLLPDLRSAGAPPVPLSEVAPKIKELLAQQQINDLLIAWLKGLRGESSIQMPSPPPSRSAGGSR